MRQFYQSYSENVFKFSAGAGDGLSAPNDGHNIKYGYSPDPLNYQTSVKVRPSKSELQ